MSRSPTKVPPAALATITAFLRGHASAPGVDGVLVGLSGGIDSALTARLAADAVGAQRVLGVQLPDASVSPELVAETEAFAGGLRIHHRVVDVGPVAASLRAALPEVTDRVTLGNGVARIRMAILYALARETRRLVLGTGNKSELLLGYFTKYGDGGVDLLPIGDLYKTEVWALAEQLALPAALLDRAPTAGFWEGQTDEGELGVSYVVVDQVLRELEALRPAREIAAATGVPPATVQQIVARVEANRHKRRLPPVAKIGLRTVGIDWRE